MEYTHQLSRFEVERSSRARSDMVVRDLGKGDAKPTIIYVNRDTKIKKRV